jgi:hypothetical protein
MRPRPGAGGRLALIAMMAALGLGACGPGSPQACPYDPPTCPDPQPSYAGEVAAIIQTFCVNCHGPGGQESNRPFVTYADISANNNLGVNVGPMQRQVLGCLMPLADAPQPSADQKAALVGWLTCGAPNN